MAASEIRKRPDEWRYVCEQCGRAGEWRDRRYWAAGDLAQHRTDRHGGSSRG